VTSTVATSGQTPPPAARLGRALAFAAACAALLFSPSDGRADPGDVRRATILVKAMSFDLDLDARVGDALVVAIAYKPGDAASQAVAASWAQAFSQLGSLRVKDAAVRAVVVPFDPPALDEAIQKQGVDAILACDGLDDVDAVARFALPRKLVTLGAKRAYVERGLILGTFVEGDKPRIVVNLGAARQGGFRFSSSMLRLAELVK
jgi:hypothetical protein